MKDRAEQRFARLFERRSLGIKPGLDTEAAVLRRLGNPERAYGVIHVAGTNGKGSVCALVSSILREHGLRVGRFTSPHLVRFNERFWIDGRCVADEVLLPCIDRVEKASSEAVPETGREATFFECCTALAFTLFREQGVDVAVMETGMGGRLDATNVVEPLVSIITPVSREHEDYLGADLASIAREKAGIVKTGRPVVYGAMPAEAVRVIRETAENAQSPAVDAARSAGVRVLTRSLLEQKVAAETAERSYGIVHLPLIGDHQAENLALVLASLDVLAGVCGVDLSTARVKQGVRKVRWPGRCQVVQQDPVVLVDGAHNPAAAERLARVVARYLRGVPLGLIVGMCGDKDAQGILGALAARVERTWAVPLDSPRRLPARRIAAAAARVGLSAETASLEDALNGAAAWAQACGGAVCVAGSLFLAGEVLGRYGALEW